MDFKSKEYRFSVALSLVIPFLMSLRSSNRVLAFLDTYTFLGLFITIIGVMNNLRLHGSFDALQYSFRRSANFISRTEYYDQPFEEYLREKQAERYGKKNVILSVGITILVISVVLSLLYTNS